MEFLTEFIKFSVVCFFICVFSFWCSFFIARGWKYGYDKSDTTVIVINMDEYSKYLEKNKEIYE